MTSFPAATLLLAAALVAVPSVVHSTPLELGPQNAPDQQNAPKKEAPKKDANSSGTSLTGCVDEQDGNYILTDDKELTPIANLRAEGFPQEGFAKHLGHKVIVRGISNPGEPRPTFTVRSIETVSEICRQQH